MSTGKLLFSIFFLTGSIAAVSFWYDTQQAADQNDSPVGCELSQGPCRFEIEGESFELAAVDSPLKSERPLKLAWTSLSSAAQWRPEELKLRGQSMNMGEFRFSFEKVSAPRRYETTIELPSCSRPTMTWIAEATLKKSGARNKQVLALLTLGK